MNFEEYFDKEPEGLEPNSFEYDILKMCWNFQQKRIDELVNVLKITLNAQEECPSHGCTCANEEIIEKVLERTI